MSFPIVARPKLEDILIIMLKVILDLHVNVQFLIVDSDSVVLSKRGMYLLYFVWNYAFD